jgi:hypothetical protein
MGEILIRVLKFQLCNTETFYIAEMQYDSIVNCCTTDRPSSRVREGVIAPNGSKSKSFILLLSRRGKALEELDRLS